LQRSHKVISVVDIRLGSVVCIRVRLLIEVTLNGAASRYNTVIDKILFRRVHKIAKSDY